MRLTHLSLSGFRNYERLELDLPPGPLVFAGDNAQGKTNLLEAAYLLSTTRSVRAASETELIRRDAPDPAIAVARVAGTAERGGGRVLVEVIVGRRDAAVGESRAAHAVKRLRVNGIPHRATTVIGQILAVFFSSQDIDLITGPPAGRRRYLDITLSQVEPAYVRALQRYNRVLQQRNSLLRQIDEGRAGADQLEPWDEELAAQGALIVVARQRAVASLNAAAAQSQESLSDARERLTLTYVPQLGGSAEQPAAGLDPAALAAHIRQALAHRRAREIAAGASLVGPHRDDLRLTLDGDPVATFGSRAQQRTVALAIRLAEAELLRQRSGETPILLLDDILSELDGHRRAAVLRLASATEQCLITTADLDRFQGAALANATRFSVQEGRVERLDGA